MIPFILCRFTKNPMTKNYDDTLDDVIKLKKKVDSQQDEIDKLNRLVAKLTKYVENHDKQLREIVNRKLPSIRSDLVRISNMRSSIKGD